MNPEYKLHAQLERNDIREEEKLELLKRNPNVHSETPSIIFGEGRQSRVSALEVIKNGSSSKVIWKRCGVDKGLTIQEAQELCARIQPYRETLKECGWNVPEVLYSEPISLTPKDAVIFSYEQLIEAIDTERMFKETDTAHFERLSVLQKIVQILTNSSHQNLEQITYLERSFSQLPYGIDLKLANLILDKNGCLYFVDFFGPKELNNDYTWKTYNSKLDSLSEENLSLVCATREGCILRMLKLALRNLPNTEDIPMYMGHFKDIITYSSLPQKEKGVIIEELEGGFPLLDKVYEEYKV